MAYVLLILTTIIGLGICAVYCRKNVLAIREKNKTEPKAYKRGLNYVFTGLWYGYLGLFFLGVTINNIFF